MKAFINNIAFDFIQGETILEFVRRIEQNKDVIHLIQILSNKLII